MSLMSRRSRDMLLRAFSRLVGRLPFTQGADSGGQRNEGLSIACPVGDSIELLARMLMMCIACL